MGKSVYHVDHSKAHSTDSTDGTVIDDDHHHVYGLYNSMSELSQSTFVLVLSVQIGRAHV